MADDNKRIDAPTGTETMGHEWDGIEELNTPLPRWWLWSFYATIVWGLAFMVFYPAWPMLSSARKARSVGRAAASSSRSLPRSARRRRR